MLRTIDWENSKFLRGTIQAHVLATLLPVLLFKEDVCETSPPLSKPLPVSQSAGNREKKELCQIFVRDANCLSNQSLQIKSSHIKLLFA